MQINMMDSQIANALGSSGRPKGVPPEALAIGPWHDVPGITGGLELKLAAMHAVQANAQLASDAWDSNWKFACNEYLRLASSARSQNWPAPKKPVPDEPQMVLHTLDEGGNGFVWVWKEAQPMPVCPDLPPLPPPVESGNVAIGNHIYGDFWQALHEDNVPGETTISGTSADGVAGVWLRLTAKGMGGMGWYQLVKRLGA